MMIFDEDGLLQEPCLSCSKAYIEDIWHEWCCDETECIYGRKRGMSKEWYSNWEYEDVIICPYCSKIYEPTYEETFIGGKEVDCYEKGEQGEFTCDECGKKFRLSVEIQWMYSTETIEGEMTEKEWEQNYD